MLLPKLNVPYGFLHRKPKDSQDLKKGYNYTYCVLFLTDKYEVVDELPIKIGNNVPGRNPKTVYRQFGFQLAEAKTVALRTFYYELEINDKTEEETAIWVNFFFPSYQSTQAKSASESGKDESGTGVDYGDGYP